MAGRIARADAQVEEGQGLEARTNVWTFSYTLTRREPGRPTVDGAALAQATALINSGEQIDRFGEIFGRQFGFAAEALRLILMMPAVVED